LVVAGKEGQAVPEDRVQIVAQPVIERAGYLQKKLPEEIGTVRVNLHAASATCSTMWVGQISHEAFNVIWNVRLSPQLEFLGNQVQEFGGRIITFAGEMMLKDGSGA
jgi:hypothetical protein